MVRGEDDDGMEMMSPYEDNVVDDFSEDDFDVDKFLPESLLGRFSKNCNPASIKTTIIKNRHCIAFWIFGLTNNYPYVIMLSAAVDILKSLNVKVGTGVILLADILPTLACKVLAPFFIHRVPYNIRVMCIVGSAILSFVLIGISQQLSVSVIGVMFASFSAGFGEITYLAMSHNFGTEVITFWSSGTGAAGLVGSFIYMFMRLFFSPRTVNFVNIIVPLLMLSSYFFVLPHRNFSNRSNQNVRYNQLLPQNGEYDDDDDDNDNDDVYVDSNNDLELTKKFEKLSIFERIKLIKPLLKYMMPLCIVYYAEYTINQGLLEHVWWENKSLSKESQYTLFQCMYQLGVFISRSSRSVFAIKRVWVVAALQILNLLLCLLDVKYQMFDFIFLFCILIFYEGLLGGLAYVNSFANIHEEATYREFALGITSVADTFGITLAGVTALLINPKITSIATPR